MDERIEGKIAESTDKKEYQEPLLIKRGLLKDVTKTPKLSSEKLPDD